MEGEEATVATGGRATSGDVNDRFLIKMQPNVL